MKIYAVDVASYDSQYTNEGRIFHVFTDGGVRIAKVAIAHSKYTEQDLGGRWDQDKRAFLSSNIEMRSLYDNLFGEDNWTLKIISTERDYDKWLRKFRKYVDKGTITPTDARGKTLWFDKDNKGLEVHSIGTTLPHNYKIHKYIKK